MVRMRGGGGGGPHDATAWRSAKDGGGNGGTAAGMVLGRASRTLRAAAAWDSLATAAPVLRLAAPPESRAAPVALLAAE